MNSKLLLPILFLAAFSSCTTLYKSGQTPDDVYFSPTREYAEPQQEVRRETRRDDPDEAQIRMAIHNRRWRYFDNDINYNPYQYGYNYGYYYNPYYCTYPVYNNVVVVAPNPKNTTPRMANLGGYGTGYNNNNITVNGKPATYIPSRTYNNSNRRTNNDSYNQNSNTNSNTRSYNTPTNTNTNTNSSTPASSGSSSSGSVSRPARGKG